MFWVTLVASVVLKINEILKKNTMKYDLSYYKSKTWRILNVQCHVKALSKEVIYKTASTLLAAKTK